MISPIMIRKMLRKQEVGKEEGRMRKKNLGKAQRAQRKRLLFFGVAGVIVLAIFFAEPHEERGLHTASEEEQNIVRIIVSKPGFILGESPEYVRMVDIMEYTIREKDTVSSIVNNLQREGIWVRPDQVIRWNSIENPDSLRPGTILKIAILQWQPHSGEASWYGHGFQGKPMANTEVFNQNDETVAAHPWYPLGMPIRVTNLETGESRELVVKDRGSFYWKYNRVLDVSREAAKELGYFRRGTTDVFIEPLGRPPQNTAQLAFHSQ